MCPIETNWSSRLQTGSETDILNKRSTSKRSQFTTEFVLTFADSRFNYEAILRGDDGVTEELFESITRMNLVARVSLLSGTNQATPASVHHFADSILTLHRGLKFREDERPTGQCQRILLSFLLTASQRKWGVLLSTLTVVLAQRFETWFCLLISYRPLHTHPLKTNYFSTEHTRLNCMQISFFFEICNQRVI